MHVQCRLRKASLGHGLLDVRISLEVKLINDSTSPRAVLATCNVVGSPEFVLGECLVTLV